MSIELHCPQCGKLIRAPEDSGGKKGRCPYCKRTVYIPTPLSDGDTIALAPIDPEEEERDAALRRESAQYAASVEKADGTTAGTGRTQSARPPKGVGEVVNIGELVSSFIRAMHESKLPEADRIVEKLKKAGARAKDHVQALTLDEIPPAVGNVPPALAQGFLKALLGRLE
ncbi:MAG: hypothetical protein IIB60_06545 [Planctomycetes bacterium]|nr:hypothetical protein [Planctomycetota bacterium]